MGGGGPAPGDYPDTPEEEEIDLREIEAARLWEANKIDMTEAFLADSCLKEAYDVLMADPAVFSAIKEFLGENPEAELIFDAEPELFDEEGDVVNGKCEPPAKNAAGEWEIRIVLSQSQARNNSRLSVARTMVHETFHAEIFRHIMEKFGSIAEINSYARDNETPFALHWRLYYENFGIEAFQHELMADVYVAEIAATLEQVHPFLENDFINWANDQTFEGVGTVNWDNYYYYLSWEGLQGTDGFKNSIEADLEEKQNFYANRRIDSDYAPSCP